MYWRNRHLLDIELPVFFAICDISGPDCSCEKRIPGIPVKGFILHSGFKETRIGGCFFERVAGKLGKSGVSSPWQKYENTSTVN
jgi:hypothetical protein